VLNITVGHFNPTKMPQYSLTREVGGLGSQFGCLSRGEDSLPLTGIQIAMPWK